MKLTYRSGAMLLLLIALVATAGITFAQSRPSARPDVAEATTQLRFAAPADQHLSVVAEPYIDTAAIQPVHEVPPAELAEPMGQTCLIQALPLDAPIGEKAAPMQCFASDSAARAAIPAGNFIVGILYKAAPPGGVNLTVWGASCNVGVAQLPAGIDNETSSLDNSCPRATLYFDPNYAGPQQSYGNGTTSYVGNGMNDQASSVTFTP